MTIRSITELVYADVPASNDRFAELLAAELETLYPDAMISVRTRPGSAGGGSSGDRVILGDSDEEIAEAAEAISDAAEDVRMRASEWLIEANASEGAN